nr:1620_t:CDS:2 [Entrophospora candida]
MTKNNSIILNKSTAPKPSIPFTILPSPFQTIIVISAAQHQQAIQKVNELDSEIRSAGVNLVLIQEVSKKQKVDYSTIISELIPLYGKINRLIPLYYIVTKNNDMAARNLIKTSLLSSSSSSSSSSLSSLLSPKNSLSSPTKSTAALMNDQNDVNKREGDGDDNNDNNDEDDDEGENIYGLGFTTKLSSGAGALAKFLSLVEDDDSFGQLSSQVGDLFVPRKFSHNNNTNNLNKKENDDDGKN